MSHSLSGSTRSSGVAMRIQQTRQMRIAGRRQHDCRQDGQQQMDNRPGQRHKQVDFGLIGHAGRDHAAERTQHDRVDLAPDSQGGQRMGQFVERARSQAARRRSARPPRPYRAPSKQRPARRTARGKCGRRPARRTSGPKASSSVGHSTPTWRAPAWVDGNGLRSTILYYGRLPQLDRHALLPNVS